MILFQLTYREDSVRLGSLSLASVLPDTQDYVTYEVLAVSANSKHYTEVQTFLFFDLMF
jgi:hypothetical protein